MIGRIHINNKKLQRLKFAVAWAAIFFAIGFFILNFQFIWKNFSYTFLYSLNEKQDSSLAERTAALQPNILSIPKIFLNVPIIHASKTNEKEFQEDLKSGVVHFPGSARIGEEGNCYIFGHSSDNLWSNGMYKTAFALLPKINRGDIIYATDSSANLYTYKVLHTKVVFPNDLSVLGQKTFGKKILTLQTSYPIGTALKRFVVVAELAP